jgi:transposase
MRLRYRFRLHPTPAQREALAMAFGCARVVYNDGLRLREEAYKAGLPWVSDNDLLRLVTTEAKRTPDRAWLAEVSAVVLQQSVADLHRAYRNYFAALAEVKAERAKGNKQAKLRVHKPKPKRRHHDQAIRFTANSRFRVLANGRLRLPKVVPALFGVRAAEWPEGTGRALRVRTWSCLACDTKHDRDVNAALNILAAGRAVAACGPDVRPPARVAAGVEAGTALAGAV